MNKANRTRILMLSGVLSLGFMGNAIYGAAAPRAPQDVIREVAAEYQARNIDGARRILEEFMSTASRHEVVAFMKEYATKHIRHKPFIILTLNAMTSARADAKGILKARDVTDILRESGFFEDEGRNTKAVRDTNNVFLAAAVQANSIDKVTSLLDKGANVNAICDGLGASVLTLAVSKGNTNIVRLLISRGVDVNYEIEKTGSNCGTKHVGTFPYNNALDCAVKRNYADIVDLLIQAGANVKCVIFHDWEGKEDSKGITLLKVAVCQGGGKCLDVIKLLVNAGATITPSILISACKKGKAAVVPVLISGLLKHQVGIQAEKYKRCLVKNGHTGDCCGTLERLSGDPLNRVLGYVGAQGCGALHRTCSGMLELQPDIEGLRIMLRQATSKKFLRIKKIYLNKSIQLSPKIKTFFEKLIEFLEEEATRPICDIEKWEASVRRTIETGELSREEINALEGLIGVVKTYYEESRRMI